MNEAEKKDAARSCTQILIEALEEFGEIEPKTLVLIYINEDGELILKRNANHTQLIGMCDAGKEMGRRAIFGAD